MDKVPENLVMLIDGDWLLHLACAAVEYKWEENEEYKEGTSPPFEYVVDVFNNKMEEFRNALNTKRQEIICFTGRNNFRYGIAVTKEYKKDRPPKPFHYQNLKAYIKASGSSLEVDGYEADDLMATLQTHDTIIVTPDKDLRQVNGWFWTPEGWNYPSFGPVQITDDNSYVKLKQEGKPGKGLDGQGYKFFWAQMIVGDSVDNIPGLPRKGPAAALKILDGRDTNEQCMEAVLEAYRDTCLLADDLFYEQYQLLHLRRNII